MKLYSFILLIFCSLPSLNKSKTHFLSKSTTGQSCAATLVCGDGYCCKYSSNCVCSADICRELCSHGDIIPSRMTGSGTEDKKGGKEGEKQTPEATQKKSKKHILINLDENELDLDLNEDEEIEKPKKHKKHNKDLNGKKLGNKILKLLKEIVTEKKHKSNTPISKQNLNIEMFRSDEERMKNSRLKRINSFKKVNTYKKYKSRKNK